MYPSGRYYPFIFILKGVKKMSIKSLVEKAAMLDLLVMKGGLTIPLIEQMTDEDREAHSNFVTENKKEVFYTDEESDRDNPYWTIASFFEYFYDAEPSRIAFVDFWDTYELDNLLPDNIEEVEDPFMIEFLSYPEKTIDDYKKQFLKKMVKEYDCNDDYSYNEVQGKLQEYIVERLVEEKTLKK